LDPNAGQDFARNAAKSLGGSLCLGTSAVEAAADCYHSFLHSSDEVRQPGVVRDGIDDRDCVARNGNVAYLQFGLGQISEINKTDMHKNLLECLQTEEKFK